MSSYAAIIHGTLKDDGTLELDERPPLAPGRVQVAILPIPAPTTTQPHRSILEVVDQIHAAQDASGYLGRSIEEMEADGAERRAEEQENENRSRAIWRQTTAPPPPGGIEGRLSTPRGRSAGLTRGRAPEQEQAKEHEF
jgi:hypothetical protein